MLTHNETIHSDYEKRAVDLEAALRVGCGLNDTGDTSIDGSIVVKNAKLFLDFLNEDNQND